MKNPKNFTLVDVLPMNIGFPEIQIIMIMIMIIIPILILILIPIPVCRGLKKGWAAEQRIGSCRGKILRISGGSKMGFAGPMLCKSSFRKTSTLW